MEDISELIEPKSSEWLEQNGKTVKVKVERIRDHREAGIIGGAWSFVALKSPTSYLIGSNLKGIKLIENRAEFFSSRLEKQFLKDICYIKRSNFYVLSFQEKIYRKDVDNKPPYEFLDVSCGQRNGASFRYSSIHHRLVIVKDRANIAVVNTDRKRVENEIKRDNKECSNIIQDFRLIGKRETGVVYLTFGGCLNLCFFSYDLKKICAQNYFQIELKKERNELPLSLAVCEKKKYLLVELMASNTFYTSRIVVFVIKSNLLVNEAVLDLHNQQIAYKMAFEFCRYVGKGRDLLWVGLSNELHGVVYLYHYDSEEKVLRELEDARVKHNEFEPFKLVEVAGRLFYTGSKGMLMCLTVEA